MKEEKWKYVVLTKTAAARDGMTTEEYLTLLKGKAAFPEDYSIDEFVDMKEVKECTPPEFISMILQDFNEVGDGDFEFVDEIFNNKGRIKFVVNGLLKEWIKERTAKQEVLDIARRLISLYKENEVELKEHESNVISLMIRDSGLDVPSLAEAWKSEQKARKEAESQLKVVNEAYVALKNDCFQYKAELKKKGLK